MYRSLIIILFLTGCWACNAQKHSSATPANYQELALSKLQEETVTCTYNADSTYVLCQTKKQKSATIPQQALKLVVFDTKTQKTVFEDQIANAQVSWHSNTKLKYEVIPGTISMEPKENKTTYLYDIIARTKTTL